MIKLIFQTLIIPFKMIYVIIKLIFVLALHFIACLICNPLIWVLNEIFGQELSYVDICKLFYKGVD